MLVVGGPGIFAVGRGVKRDTTAPLPRICRRLVDLGLVGLQADRLPGARGARWWRGPPARQSLAAWNDTASPEPNRACRCAPRRWWCARRPPERLAAGEEVVSWAATRSRSTTVGRRAAQAIVGLLVGIDWWV
jgi:hypothetical protein